MIKDCLGEKFEFGREFLSSTASLIVANRQCNLESYMGRLKS